MSITGWILVLAIVVVALGLLIDKIKGGKLQKWLEKTYWGALPEKSRYSGEEAKEEAADLQLAMAGGR